MKFNWFRKNKKEKQVEETVNNSQATGIVNNTEYHVGESQLRTRQEILESNISIPEEFVNSANIVIDDIKPNPAIERSKEIMDKLNRKDNIIGFKAELRNFTDQINAKSREIEHIVNAFTEKLEKYINDTNVI